MDTAAYVFSRLGSRDEGRWGVGTVSSKVFLSSSLSFFAVSVNM